MFVIEFRGWFVYRLPTDPDPTDEGRGVSGYTFALAGEPDLDRIICFRDLGGFTPRSHTPRLGVNVFRAHVTAPGGRDLELKELVGASVDLLGRPMLENRNWLLTPPGQEPIVPFQLEIAKDGLRIFREDYLDPTDPQRPVYEATPDQLRRRGATGIALDALAIGQATGVWDPLQIIRDRKGTLEQEREKARAEGDEVAVAALGKRLDELAIALAPENRMDRRVLARQAIERFAFDMNGAWRIDDPEGVLGGSPDPSATWSLAFWMGAWDPDTLTAFANGALRIPLLPASAPKR